MLAVLSPSKTMDMSPSASTDFNHPRFLQRSEQLIDELRGLSVGQLTELMGISEKLGALNAQRYTDWHLPFALGPAKQALFAFSGDVYEGLAADTLNPAEVAYAEEHLRILSGLYGLLHPLDLIMPYRLEMGCKLATEGARNLYEFWRETLTAELNASGESLLVNLASQEYFKAIDKRKLQMQVVSPVFKDEKNGTFKVISFYAKKARGMMARYMVRERIEDVAGLIGFAEAGYVYEPALSTENEPVFIRSADSLH